MAVDVDAALEDEDGNDEGSDAEDASEDNSFYVCCC